MRFEILRVMWESITGMTVASLVGPVDATASDVIIGMQRVAEEVPRLIVDLEGVTYVDAAGVMLLESLTEQPNVGIVNISSAVQDELERLGKLGL